MYAKVDSRLVIANQRSLQIVDMDACVYALMFVELCAPVRGSSGVVGDLRHDKFTQRSPALCSSLARVAINSHPSKRRLERATSIPRASAMMIVIMIMISRHHHHASTVPLRSPSACGPSENSRVVRGRRPLTSGRYGNTTDLGKSIPNNPLE